LKHLTVLLLCALLAACMSRPPVRPAAELLDDRLFAPSGVLIDPAAVFALDDDMRRYAEAELQAATHGRDPRRALTLSLEEPNQTRRTEATGLTLARWAAKEAAAATMALREAAPFLDLPALIPVLEGAGSMRVGGKTIHYIVGHNGSALVPVVEQLIATSP
jgi:hypothetical protein